MYTPSLNWFAWILFQMMVGNHHFQSFCVNQRAKFWPWPKSEPILNTHPRSVHTKFELDCVNTFSNNGLKPLFWPIFNRFLVTRGPKLGQCCPKANQFWTLTRQMNTPNLKLIEWLLFQIMVENPAQMDRRKDAHHSYVPPDFVYRDIHLVSLAS